MKIPLEMHRYSGLFTCACLLACLFGCGGDDNRSTISGKVQLNGEPVPAGVITFLAEDGPSAGGQIVDGVYSIEQNGPMIGKNSVQISWLKKTGKKIPAGSPAPEGTMIDEAIEAIPPQYNFQTELTLEVEPGSNTHDFMLTSE